MKKLKINKKIVCRAVAAVIIAAACCFFTVDLIRAKTYGLPPLFCIRAYTYDNGSSDWYGFFYKVWEDYHPYDRTTVYYVCFWLLPKFVHL